MCSPPKSRPSRVLFALPSLVLGGSERVIRNLLRHLDAEGFEPHVAVLEKGGVWLENVPPHVHVHELGVWRARHAVVPLAILCWKIKPQAVLSTSAHLNSALVAARPLLPRGTRLLAREGADLTSAHATFGRFRMLVYKHVYRRADLVICQSDHMKKNLIHEFGLARSNVVRIYNPVDINSIGVLASSEPRPFSDPGPNLIAVGRFSHEKGFDLLLRAMSHVRQAVPTAVVTLVGEGPDLPLLQALQRELGLESCVRFVGVRRNPYPFLKHADLAVLPSRTEALPNVVLEAIAVGTPVVATNCTGALSEISSCTQRMRVAKDTTTTALTSEILRELSGATARLKGSPEPQFEARFGVHAITRQYEHAVSDTMRTGSVEISEHANAAA